MNRAPRADACPGPGPLPVPVCSMFPIVVNWLTPERPLYRIAHGRLVPKRESFGMVNRAGLSAAGWRAA